MVVEGRSVGCVDYMEVGAAAIQGAFGSLSVGPRGVAGKQLGILGQHGVKTSSKTIWKGKGKERIDVENPNPGQRPGQIHYQDNHGNKYLYDPNTSSFPNAPKSVNKLLENSQFRSAVDKGLKKYLGE